MAVFIKKVNIPQKSDLINIDMTGSGTAQTYRVIKNVGGDVYEVMSMSDDLISAFGSDNIYAGSTLDTYLNSTWYNTLSNTAKQAIVDKIFRQDSWYLDTTGNPDYVGLKIGDTSYQVSLGNTSFGNEITRHGYVLSVQDIIDYLEVTPEMTSSNTTLNATNILTMFLNTASSENKIIRLRSAEPSGYGFIVNCNYGDLSFITNNQNRIVRPAFQIDLSKIDYTFADGRSSVELKPVSTFQKSNNALSRVGLSWKIVPSTYNGNITTYFTDGFMTTTRIKFDTAPNNNDDYDAYVYWDGTLTGSTTYSNKTKVYVWGSNTPKIKINNVEYEGSENYSTATEIPLTGDYDISLGFFPDIG